MIYNNTSQSWVKIRFSNLNCVPLTRIKFLGNMETGAGENFEAESKTFSLYLFVKTLSLKILTSLKIIIIILD